MCGSLSCGPYMNPKLIYVLCGYQCFLNLLFLHKDFFNCYFFLCRNVLLKSQHSWRFSGIGLKSLGLLRVIF